MGAVSKALWFAAGALTTIAAAGVIDLLLDRDRVHEPEDLEEYGEYIPPKDDGKAPYGHQCVDFPAEIRVNISKQMSDAELLRQLRNPLYYNHCDYYPGRSAG